MIKLLRVIPGLFFLLLAFLQQGCAQDIPEERPSIQNPAFDTTIARMIDFSVPVMGVEELKNIQNEVVIFDTRNRQEYEVSHIPGAGFLGYEEYEPETVKALPKDTTIVLYCSIGYRSEKIGNRLKKLGFKNVYNLYGSIFEWANRGYPLVGTGNDTTQVLHTYNRKWSKWVEAPRIEKTW